MADKKLNELSTTADFDNAYVEKSNNQYKISKQNLGSQLTSYVHKDFAAATDAPSYIYAEKSNGTGFKISKTDLAGALAGDSKLADPTLVANRALYDGHFIMYHRQSDGWVLFAQYHEWPSLQNAGGEADGVLIIEGGHTLVVAPHEKGAYWSSHYGDSGAGFEGYSGNNRVKLADVWDGRTRTNIIVNSEAFKADNQDASAGVYAPGYCHNYTPHTTTGIAGGTPVQSEEEAAKKGLKAGKYWLPCVAELLMIKAHKYKINAGLALINGAQQLSETWYWSSTEYSTSSAWRLGLYDGTLGGWDNKVTYSGEVRPVSALLHQGY